MSLQTLSIRENESFALPKRVPKGWFARLKNCGDRTRRGSFLLGAENRVQTKGIVGVFQFESLRLEILPKNVSHGEGAMQGLTLLARLLLEVGCIENTPFMQSDAEAVRSLSELSFRVFARELIASIDVGLPRNYETETVRSSVIRGRISVKDIHVSVTNPAAGMTLIHSPLTFDNTFSRAVLSCARMLEELTDSYETKQLLALCQQSLRQGGVTSVGIDSLFNRRSVLQNAPVPQHWEMAKAFVVRFLDNLVLNGFSTGADRFFSQLYSVEQLFERLIRKRISETLKDTAFELAPKHKLDGVLTHLESGVSIGTYSADIVITTRNTTAEKRRTIVGDVKWKEPVQAVTLRPSNQDLYQIAFYMQRYAAQGAMLVYPKQSEMSPGPGAIVDVYKFGYSSRLTVCAVSLWHMLLPKRNAERQEADNALSRLLRDVCDAPN